MNTLQRRFAEFLIAGRYPLLLAAVALAALAYGPARRVVFDRSIESMFAADDPLLAPYERLKSRFGGNEVVLAVYIDEGLLAPDGSGLQRLSQVSAEFKRTTGVKDVLRLAEVNSLLSRLKSTGNPFGVLELFQKRSWQGPPLLDPNNALAKEYLALFEGYTHAADGQTVAIACMLQPEPSSGTADSSAPDSDGRRETIRQLREIIQRQRGGVLAGEPVMVVEGFRLLELDGQRLALWSTILLGLTILACFQSLRWLLLPIAVVQWTLLVTRAALLWAGLELTMVSSMLAAIVTVVGVATVMHLIVRFRELRTLGREPREALRDTLVLLIGPIVGAIATDVAGFGSLWWASVGPVQDFGTMMVVGSLLVLPAIALLAPAMTLIGWHAKRPQPGWGEAGLDAQLSALVRMVRRRPRFVALLTIVVSAIAAAGAARLEVETDFTKNFRADSSLVQAYEFVETKLGGAGVWDVIVPAPAVLNEEYLQRVRALEDKLRAIRGNSSLVPDQPALTKVLSLADALEAAKNDPTLAILPPELRARGMAAMMPTFLGALRDATPDEHGQGALRIMLRARERQSAAQKQQLIADVTRLAREAFPQHENSRGAEVTGFFVLLTNLIESMLRDQWTTFGVATAGIALLMLICFRSVKMMAIALVPNLLPVFIVMGLLGWAGLKINMGAAMIAAVSMGLSVDSSIHYLVSFRRARQGRTTVAAALDEVQSSVGRAVVLSTLALIVGFAVLCTSEFVPTIYFGALVSLAMLGGLVGNLIILPLLLGWLERE